MADFSFIFEASIRTIVERDYEELQGLDTRTSTKSVIVLSGGIIEGLLLDAVSVVRIQLLDYGTLKAENCNSN
jgi:hypothetical protein